MVDVLTVELNYKKVGTLMKLNPLEEIGNGYHLNLFIK